MKRKLNLWVTLGILQIIVAIGAIPFGIGFIRDPSGQSAGMNISMLDNSPFIDFYFPGLFLLIFLGLGNLLSGAVSFLKIEVSGFLGLALGTILMCWLFLQVWWIGFTSFLQPLLFIFGFFEALTGFILLRRVIRLVEP